MNDPNLPVHSGVSQLLGYESDSNQSSSSKIYIFSVVSLIRSSTLQTADLRVHKVPSWRLADVILLSPRSSYGNP
jgi:hypothetical protein